jgi:hypothetical protein
LGLNVTLTVQVVLVRSLAAAGIGMAEAWKPMPVEPFHLLGCERCPDLLDHRRKNRCMPWVILEEKTILPVPLTLEHAMATILAIDLGKFNSVFAGSTV